MNNMFRIFLTGLVWASSLTPCFPQGKSYSLSDIIQMAKDQSPFSRQAETRKENRYWSYRLYRSNLNPQLRIGGTVPNFSRTTEAIIQPDGSINYGLIDQMSTNSRLSLYQSIPWTGGSVYMNSNLDYFRNNKNNLSSWRGDPFNITLVQPLLAYNPIRWDMKTEPLRFEESKRSYVEEMEFISRQTVQLFFNVLDAQINLQIATYNLANNDTIYQIENGRYNIGTTTKDKLLQAELQQLRSRKDVTQARISLQDAKLAFRSFLGLKTLDEFDMILPEALPIMNLSQEEALAEARANRSAYVAFERRKLEAEREVAQAKGQRYQMNMALTYGMSNTGPLAQDVYKNPLSQQSLNVGFNIPILNWGRNQARMQMALANKKLNDYVIAQDEVNFEQEIITQVRQFEVLLSQIEITKKSDEVAQERYVVSQNRYLVGKIDITDLNIALTEKDTAKRNYLNALRAYWTAFYDLRQLTLYDFVNGIKLYTTED